MTFANKTWKNERILLIHSLMQFCFVPRYSNHTIKVFLVLFATYLLRIIQRKFSVKCFKNFWKHSFNHFSWNCFKDFNYNCSLDSFRIYYATVVAPDGVRPFGRMLKRSSEIFPYFNDRLSFLVYPFGDK